MPLSEEKKSKFLICLIVAMIFALACIVLDISTQTKVAYANEGDEKVRVCRASEDGAMGTLTVTREYSLHSGYDQNPLEVLTSPYDEKFLQYQLPQSTGLKYIGILTRRDGKPKLAYAIDNTDKRVDICMDITFEDGVYYSIMTQKRWHPKETEQTLIIFQGGKPYKVLDD